MFIPVSRQERPTNATRDRNHAGKRGWIELMTAGKVMTAGRRMMPKMQAISPVYPDVRVPYCLIALFRDWNWK